MCWHKISVIIIEAHTKKTKPEYQGSALADLNAKAGTTKSIKIGAHVDEAHPASAKMAPHCQIFTFLMSL